MVVEGFAVEGFAVVSTDVLVESEEETLEVLFSGSSVVSGGVVIVVVSVAEVVAPGVVPVVID